MGATVNSEQGSSMIKTLEMMSLKGLNKVNLGEED